MDGWAFKTNINFEVMNGFVIFKSINELIKLYFVCIF